jgi:hypothetical protein
MQHYQQHPYFVQHHYWGINHGQQYFMPPTTLPIQQSEGPKYMIQNPVKEHKANWKAFCRVCGYERALHQGRSENFGKGRCKHELCAYCQLSYIHHQSEAQKRNLKEEVFNDLMGEHCIFTTTYHEKNIKE